MEFLVCERQEDEGCHYTIGCGMKFSIIDAESVNDAANKVIWPDGIAAEEYCTLIDGDDIRNRIYVAPMDAVHVVDIDAMTVLAEKVRDSKVVEPATNEELAKWYSEKMARIGNHRLGWKDRMDALNADFQRRSYEIAYNGR
jgi:hypothetical protein